MSRKSRRNRADATPAEAPPPAAQGRADWKPFALGLLGAFVVAVIAGVLLLGGGRGDGEGNAGAGSEAPDPAWTAALASEHAPTLGEASAKVHVVEFLDPACETCAAFFPIVKQLMAENPGRIRLSVRHVAFHDGAEAAVRVLEASRAQDRYWETLEALLGSQSLWAPNHTVQPERVMQAVANVGLDLPRLEADMNSPEVTERIARDRRDAATVKVRATPEYYVNGRPLPSFGEAPLRQLVADALREAY